MNDNKIYSRDGLTVTEIEAFTMLNSPLLSLISFKVEVNGESRIDTLNEGDEFDKKIIDYLSQPTHNHNRAEAYYDIIK